MNDESNLRLLQYSIIYLEDKKEYDRLADLKSSLEHFEKIMQSYWYDLYSADFDPKLFLITKEDRDKEK